MPRNTSSKSVKGNGNNSPNSNNNLNNNNNNSNVPSSVLHMSKDSSTHGSRGGRDSGNSSLTGNTDPEFYTGKVYNSVGQHKIDWSEVSIISAKAQDAIIGTGSYGTVVKALWKPKGKLSHKSMAALEGESIQNGVVVAVKVFTRSLAGAGNEFNISKLYQQACDEVNLIRSAEDRIFDIGCIVHPFGVAKGPLTGDMCNFFHIQQGEEGIGIIMRLEGGGSLESLVHNSKKLQAAEPLIMTEKVRILSEVARGLAELHAAGIVHADIKTDNVLLSHHRPCKVRLADFGLSLLRKENENDHVGQSTLTMTTHLRGTPIYCAPELLTNPFEEHKEGEEVYIAKASRKSDMYSFAILMWEVLSQKLPFTDIKTEGQLCTKIHQGHRPPLTELPRDTPKVLIELMEACWQKDRNIRKPAVECSFILQSLYYSAINQKPDIFFRHAAIPKLFLSHIFFYFIRLGYYICSDDIIPRATVDDTMSKSKIVILCLDHEFQKSKPCMNDLRKLKEKFPEKKVLTLIVEEKLMAWVKEETRELCDFDTNNTVDIGHIGRAHWNSEEGPDAAMLTALTKNLEPLRDLIVKVTGVPPPKGNLESLRATSKSARVSGNSAAKHANKIKTAEILAGLELCVAVYEGDLSYLRSLLESGCPVNASDYDYRTAAHICCAENLIQAALILYEHKADFTSEKSRDRWGRTPIEEAQNHGHTHLVSVLRNLIEVDNQKRLKVSQHEKNMANMAEIADKQDCVGLELCVAAFEGDTSYLRALLESGCPVGAADYDLRTPAHISCAENHLDIVRILNEFGADFHSAKVKDRYGNTPLMEAEKHGHKEVVAAVKVMVAEREKRRAENKVRAIEKKRNK